MTNETKKNPSETKKKNKFVDWWLGLSKPLKGVLISAASLGAASAIVFPTLAATGVFSKKDNGIVTEAEWKNAFEMIDVSKYGKTGSFKLDVEAMSVASTQKITLLVEGAKSTATTPEREDPEYNQYRSDGKYFTYNLNSSNWEEKDPEHEGISNVGRQYLFISDCYNKFSSFAKQTSNIYTGHFVVTVAGNNLDVNFEIGFSNKKVSSIKTTAVHPTTSELLNLATASFTDYGSTHMPSGYPNDKPLPQA